MDEPVDKFVAGPVDERVTRPAADPLAAPAADPQAGALASPPADPAAGRDGAYWRSTRRLTAILLLAWIATSFLAVFFARELAGLTIFGWPLSFYLAAQGASLAYLAIIGIHAWRMRRLERRYREHP